MSESDTMMGLHNFVKALIGSAIISPSCEIRTLSITII